jgi:hypothetical protein
MTSDVFEDYVLIITLVIKFHQNPSTNKYPCNDNAYRRADSARLTAAVTKNAYKFQYKIVLQ